MGASDPDRRRPAAASRDLRLPTGDQHELVAGAHRAWVTEVGATLRDYRYRGSGVIDGFGADGRSTFGRGQVLAPWPNRVRDGVYRFSGRERQLPIDEPSVNNAIHGLVRWLPWTATEKAPERVRMALVLYPRDGYPFLVELAVTYELDETDGLSVRLEARNAGPRPCPFGAGFHPYLRAGTDHLDEVLLHCPAETHLVSDERGIPVGSAPVAGSQWDFNQPRPVGPVVLDTCFTGLARDADGLCRVRLSGPGSAPGPHSGPDVTVWMDGAFGFVMIFSGDTLPPAQRRTALAVEPMTCAPDAFRSGAGLVVLEPGQTLSASWGITPGMAAPGLRR